MSGVVALKRLSGALSEGGRLGIAVAVSLMLHAVLLSLHFRFPDASRAFQEKALEIILVNAKSAHRPTDAQARAQNNLDGGGSSDQNRRVRTPLPPSTRQQAGNDVEHAQRRVQALEARQKELLTQARSRRVAATGDSRQATPPTEIEAVPGGVDLVTRSLEMARLEGEIARDTDGYNKRPRVKNLGARTEEYRFARYVEDWRMKVERIGTLNYPDAARGKIYGSLVLSVRIKRDGSVERVVIERSSGNRVLDDAARRIVRMAEPFAAFPPDIARDFDMIEITRTWTFTKGDQVTAGQ